MPKFEHLSLRQRLLLWLLPPIILLTGIWIGVAYAIILHFTNLAYDRALEDTVQTLASQVHIEPDRVEINLPPAARRMLEFDQVDTVYFSVSDEHGHQLVGNHVLPPNPDDDKAPGETWFYNDVIDGKYLRLVEYTIPNHHTGEAIHVRVAETLNKRKILSREVLTYYMLAPQFLFLSGIGLLVWYGIGRGIAPLSRIRDAIAQRTHEDLSPLVETGLPAEVREQVHVINDLMARLGRTIAAQRRFIADATHQLRTPITVLRTQIELALRADPDNLRTFITKLDATSARLSRLTNQLLNLNRAEAGLTGAPEFASLAVDEWIEDVVAEHVPMALDKAIEISVDIAEAIPAIRGDRQLLSEMLANLIDNAIRYTPAGGRIKVDARQVRENVVLTITDNGPGIPQSEKQHVLKRFYRGIETGAFVGSGLGLTIAHEILVLHGGRIELAAVSKENSGLRVTVEIPVTVTASR